MMGKLITDVVVWGVVFCFGLVAASFLLIGLGARSVLDQQLFALGCVLAVLLMVFAQLRLLATEAAQRAARMERMFGDLIVGATLEENRAELREVVTARREHARARRQRQSTTAVVTVLALCATVAVALWWMAREGLLPATHSM